MLEPTIVGVPGTRCPLAPEGDLGYSGPVLSESSRLLELDLESGELALTLPVGSTRRAFIGARH
jgi:hypothetical protein